MSTNFAYMPPIKDCHEHCCSGFYRLEQVPQNLAGPNLSNPIHPIFAMGQFASTIDYAVLETSLRLASHLLEASIPFFGHILFANKVPFSVDPRKKASYELQTDFAYPTDAQLQMTKRTLVDFAPVVLFDLTASRTQSGEACDLPSSTYLGIFIPNRNTRYTMIKLARRYYQQAVEVHSGRVTDVVEVHWNLFNIAVTLVHEVVHAFTMTVMAWENYPPAMLPDVYFPGCICAEEGYEWENQTFGGLVSARGPSFQSELAGHYIGGEGKHFYSFMSNGRETEQASDMTRMISMADWPNLALFESYRASGDSMGCRGTLREVHIRWNVDFQDIHRLFQNRFWTHPIVPGKLVFAKRTGQRFFGNQQQDCEGQECPFGTVSDGDVDVTDGMYSGCRVHYHPSNGGTGLVLAPGCTHPFEAARLWREGWR